MRRASASLALLAALLSCSTCRPSSLDEAGSLVGADRLPFPGALSLEIIQINRGFGEIGSEFLSYELRPDDSLTVTHTDRARGRVRGEDRFRLSPEIADRVRRKLWRLRPAKLQGLDSDEVRPSGCSRRGPHDFGELSVIFIDEGGKPGIDDDSLGTFELPRLRSCDSASAREARQLMRQVFETLPPSAVATEHARFLAEE